MFGLKFIEFWHASYPIYMNDLILMFSDACYAVQKYLKFNEFFWAKNAAHNLFIAHYCFVEYPRIYVLNAFILLISFRAIFMLTALSRWKKDGSRETNKNFVQK